MLPRHKSVFDLEWTALQPRTAINELYPLITHCGSSMQEVGNETQKLTYRAHGHDQSVRLRHFIKQERVRYIGCHPAKHWSDRQCRLVRLGQTDRPQLLHQWCSNRSGAALAPLFVHQQGQLRKTRARRLRHERQGRYRTPGRTWLGVQPKRPRRIVRAAGR